MTRLGGTILVLIVLTAIGFASVVSFGSSSKPPGSRGQALSGEPAPGASLAIPVAGVTSNALRDTWGDSRDDGGRVHQAIDIVAAGQTPVLAAASGRVEKLFQSEAGGITLYVRSPDGRWSYYYAHLSGYAPDISEGTSIETGMVLGYVGDTGNAGAGNTHLHFGVSRMRRGDQWWQGEPINPFPLLAGKPLHR